MVQKSEEDRMDFIHSREACNTGIPNNDPPLNAFSRTDRLFIRNFHPSDTYAVHQYTSDPIVTEMTYWGPYNESATEGFVQKSIKRSEENPRIFLISQLYRTIGKVHA